MIDNTSTRNDSSNSTIDNSTRSSRLQTAPLAETKTGTIKRRRFAKLSGVEPGQYLALWATCSQPPRFPPAGLVVKPSSPCVLVIPSHPLLHTFQEICGLPRKTFMRRWIPESFGPEALVLEQSLEDLQRHAPPRVLVKDSFEHGLNLDCLYFYRANCYILRMVQSV